MNPSALQGAADIAAARRIIAGLLQAAGKESPALDARLLIGHALGLSHTALASSPERKLTDTERALITQLTDRRLAGEPLARILGVKEFWGLPLALSQATLVPRPDTETIVEAALALIDEKHSRDAPLAIADLGVGSGAILLALLHELPNAFGVGTDLSIEALTTARRNAQDLGLSSRAGFIRGHYGDALKQKFDLVVSNPPYIATADISTLAVEVRAHDPLLALDGGTDGYDAYRALARTAGNMLRGDGCMVIEIGAGQSTYAEKLFAAEGFALVKAQGDLAGVLRALGFRRKG